MAMNLSLLITDKRVGAYLGNYLSTIFRVLIFVQIDPNLRIASKQIKRQIRTNIYKVLQFIRVNLHSVNVALIVGPTYSFNHLEMIKLCGFT